MKKYNLSKIMKRAWEIKKENKENIFAICLEMAWQEAITKRVQAFLLNKGNKVWEKGGHKRIYVNNIKYFLDMKKIESVNVNIVYKKTVCELAQLVGGGYSVYYDCVNDEFRFTPASSKFVEDIIMNACKKIRKLA